MEERETTLRKERESCNGLRKRRERKELLCAVAVGEEEDEGLFQVCVFLPFA